MSEPPMRYILSAGRTGTVYLSHLINESVKGAYAAHEPDWSRYQMILANVRNDLGIGDRLLRWTFERSREAREQATSDNYVEVNPFLCPMADLIPMAGRSLRIVHLVRDPASWAASICAFKASSRFRHWIDAVPFAKPYPVPRPASWHHLDEFERALWRWNWCNSKIAALKFTADAYEVVRFEEITSRKQEVCEAALDRISMTLDLPDRIRLPRGDRSHPTNPSTGAKSSQNLDTVKRITGEIARSYGYDY